MEFSVPSFVSGPPVVGGAAGAIIDPLRPLIIIIITDTK